MCDNCSLQLVRNTVAKVRSVEIQPFILAKQVDDKTCHINNDIFPVCYFPANYVCHAPNPGLLLCKLGAIVSHDGSPADSGLKSVSAVSECNKKCGNDSRLWFGCRRPDAAGRGAKFGNWTKLTE